MLIPEPPRRTRTPLPVRMLVGGWVCGGGAHAHTSLKCRRAGGQPRSLSLSLSSSPSVPPSLPPTCWCARQHTRWARQHNRSRETFRRRGCWGISRCRRSAPPGCTRCRPPAAGCAARAHTRSWLTRQPAICRRSLTPAPASNQLPPMRRLAPCVLAFLFACVRRERAREREKSWRMLQCHWVCTKN